MGSLTTIDNTFPNAHHPALVTLDTGITKAAAFCGHSVGFSHSNQLCSDFVTLSIGIGDTVDRSVIESHSYLLGVGCTYHTATMELQGNPPICTITVLDLCVFKGNMLLVQNQFLGF